MEWETQQGDYTFFGHPRGGNYYVSYKPYHALRRDGCRNTKNSELLRWCIHTD